MTDKQIEEKKKEFIDKFSTTIIREWQPYKVYNTSDKDLDEVWQWIEELIKEVEKQHEEMSFERFREKLLSDLEKKLTN